MYDADLPTPPEPASHPDVDELIRLRHSMFYDMARTGAAARPDALDDESWHAAAAAAFVDQMQQGRLGAFVVRNSRQTSLVGCAVAQLVERLPGPGFPTGLSGSLSTVYVEPARRGSGIGRALAIAALNWLDAAGVEVTDLHATPDSDALYRSLGFAPATSTALRRMGTEVL